MTVTAQAAQQALAVAGKIAVVPELAAPILELLKAAGDDPGKLAALTARVLEQVKGELPVAASRAKPAAGAISADQILKGFSATPATEAKLASHKALILSLTLPGKQSVRAVLTELLGRDQAKQLLKDRCDNTNAKLGRIAPSQNGATFFPKSNRKSRSTQDADFKAAGLSGFADDLQATLVCAALVRRARDAGIDLTKPREEWDVTATAKLKPEAPGPKAKLEEIGKLLQKKAPTGIGRIDKDDF